MKNPYPKLKFSDFELKKKYNFILLDAGNVEMIDVRGKKAYLRFEAMCNEDYQEFHMKKGKKCSVDFGIGCFSHQWGMKCKHPITDNEKYNFEIEFERITRSRFVIHKIKRLENEE